MADGWEHGVEPEMAQAYATERALKQQAERDRDAALERETRLRKALREIKTLAMWTQSEDALLRAIEIASAADREALAPTQPDREPRFCPRCNGMGWKIADRGMGTQQEVTWCDCPAGQKAKRKRAPLYPPEPESAQPDRECP